MRNGYIADSYYCVYISYLAWLQNLQRDEKIKKEAKMRKLTQREVQDNKSVIIAGFFITWQNEIYSVLLI